MLRAQRCVVETEALRCTRCQVLNEHVGLADQSAENLGDLGILHVERHAFLRAVEPYEIRRLPVDRLIVIAREVTDLRPLDLDHARTEIRELTRCERRSDRLLERYYSYSIKRSVHLNLNSKS